MQNKDGRILVDDLSRAWAAGRSGGLKIKVKDRQTRRSSVYSQGVGPSSRSRLVGQEV